MDLFQQIFNLPASCTFHTVIPKNAFEKHQTLLPAEKKLISIPYLPIQAVLRASLMQSRSFVPPYTDDQMDYEDILFFSVHCKPEHLDKYSDKLIQMYQKYIPKACVLLLYDDTRFIINTALKKYNEADAKKRVITEQLTTPILSLVHSDTQQDKWIEKLNFNQLDKQNLKTLHQNYASHIINYNIASTIGAEGKGNDIATSAQGLREIKQLEKELDAIRNHIRKSKKIDEQIELKLLLKAKKETLQAIKDTL